MFKVTGVSIRVVQYFSTELQKTPKIYISPHTFTYILTYNVHICKLPINHGMSKWQAYSSLAMITSESPL